MDNHSPTPIKLSLRLVICHDQVLRITELPLTSSATLVELLNLSVNLSFPICKMGLVMLSVSQRVLFKCSDTCEASRMVFAKHTVFLL